ncbi:GNAT family N-acetyltransferase [Kitasatospora acidiphila]|uniref:GNAT family N-acetyltransferase n=1 Tax=Kitasatospora acidiphila TaxID=2567942 RepID=A0A540W446_9ACTN|nr:GNAT family N-acetyltransferase [Kitasatospora acidiphila]TQF03800.1 GNAT family N-acetyltransferase [Kitasatospora acidiphila]
MAPSTRAGRPEDLGPLLALGADIAPALLETALREGRVRVAVLDGALAGYVAVEKPLPGHVRLSSIGVSPACRRRRVATCLLYDVLGATGETEAGGGTISAVAGLANLAVAGLLLSCGFIATRMLPADVAGQQPQLYYQHKIRVEYIDPDARHLVPASRWDLVTESLTPSDHAVTAIALLSGEPAFEISRFERDDPAQLQSGEAAAGLAFSGTILAAITFLLGFSFASERYPDDVRLLLIGATFATTMSLIIYASASGELARIRSNAFGRIMKWGNVLSEYGGVLPFLASLPITYAQVSGSRWSAVVTGVFLGAALVVYERSEFSIAHRFRWSRTATALAGLTCMLPLVCVVMVALKLPSWPWTAVLAAALTGRTMLYLYRRAAESGIAERRRTWQIRQ